MDTHRAWWTRTRGLMITCLIVWGFFGFVVHLFVAALDNIVFLGFPLGFYLAGQGSLIAFAALVFWFAGRQEAIDRRYGMSED